MAVNEVDNAAFVYPVCSTLHWEGTTGLCRCPIRRCKDIQNCERWNPAILWEDVSQEVQKGNTVQSPQEALTRLKHLAAAWTRRSKTRDKLFYLIVTEQFLAILPMHIRMAMIEREPMNSEEVDKMEGYHLHVCSITMSSLEKAALLTTKCPLF